MCLRLDGKHPDELESHGEEISHSRTGAGPVLINNDRLSSTVLSGAGEFLVGGRRRSLIFVVLITFAFSIYIVCTA